MFWRAIAIAPGYPTEPDGKTTVLKTQHTLAMEHEKVKLVLTRELPPWWLASKYPMVLCRALVEKTFTIALQSSEQSKLYNKDLARHAHDATVAPKL